MSSKDYEVRDTWYDKSVPEYLKKLDQATKDWYLEKRHKISRDIYIKNNFQMSVIKLLYWTGKTHGEEEDYDSENYN